MKKVRMIITLSLALDMVILTGGCVSSKPETSLQKRLNGVSARCERIAVYAGVAVDALPLIAGELKWSAERVALIRPRLELIRDTARQVSTALGQIADEAITPDQKLVIVPLVRVLVDSVAALQDQGLFDVAGASRLDDGIRLAVITMRAVVQLLPLFEVSR